MAMVEVVPEAATIFPETFARCKARKDVKMPICIPKPAAKPITQYQFSENWLTAKSQPEIRLKTEKYKNNKIKLAPKPKMIDFLITLFFLAADRPWRIQELK